MFALLLLPKHTKKERKRGEKKKKKRERFFCVCVRNPKPYIVTHAFFFCILKKRLSVTKSFIIVGVSLVVSVVRVFPAAAFEKPLR